MKEKILENRLTLIWIIVFLVLVICVVYFLAKKTKNVPEEQLTIPLKSGEMINWFVISNKYYVEHKSGDRYVNLYVEYPELMPNEPKDNFSIKKTVRILLDSYSESEKDEVKTFLKHANGKGCDPNDVCDTELVSKTEQYEIFEDTAPKDKSKYYYFEAYDGQHVLLEEHGISSNTFLEKRNIDGYLHVQYQYPVEFGKDFFKIDKEITEFIKQHLKLKHFKNSVNIATLPKVQGYGTVHSLNQVMALIDQLLDAWVDNGGMAESMTQRVANDGKWKVVA